MSDDETWFDRWGTLGPQAYLEAIRRMPALALPVQERSPEDEAAIKKWCRALTVPLAPGDEAGYNRAHSRTHALEPSAEDLSEPEVADARFIADRMGVASSTVMNWGHRPGFPSAVAERPRRWRWAEVKQWTPPQNPETRAYGMVRVAANRPSGPEAWARVKAILEAPLPPVKPEEAERRSAEHETQRAAEARRSARTAWRVPRG